MYAHEKEFDPEQFQELCGLHCTQIEIAAVLKMCRETLRKKVEEYYEQPFAEVYDHFQAQGRPSLRRTQRMLAEKNPAMAIWLGKHWLNQKEEVGLGVSGNVVFELVSFAEEGSWRKEAEISEEDSDT